MHRLFLLFLTLCVVLVTGCGPAPGELATAANPPTLANSPVPAATATDAPTRHYEPAGGFSYVPPEGWEMAEPSAATTYKVARRQSGDGFAANLTLVDEAFTGSLEEYVSLSVGNMGEFFEGVSIISRDTFELDEGAPGVRVATENKQSGMELHQTFYFFDLGDKKLVVTCTRPANSDKEVDALCDASVRTFRFEAD